MLTQNEEADNEIKNKYWAKMTPESRVREVERLRSLARHNEASALSHARDEESKKWQKVVAEKDAVIADKDAEITDQAAKLADQTVEIARLREQLEKK